MVTRLSPGAVVVVVPSTTVWLGDGGGAIVPFKLGSVLSHSSSCLAASGRGGFSPEESLERTSGLLQSTHPQVCRKRNNKEKE